MGVAERRAREKEEMRQQILDAAVEIFKEKGFEKVQIRKIAEKIEYSTGTIYLYFKNKDEIFYALHEAFFMKLYQQLLPLMEIGNPLDRLLKIGRTYINFGLENPDAYDLMFIEKAPMELIENEDQWSCAMGTFEILVHTVQACIDEGYFQARDHMDLVFLAFASVHGMVTLHNRRHMKMFPPETHKHLVNNSLNTMINMMRNQHKSPD